ncbi:MAG TPA: AbrB/MazE/SpoVT family DNA-binding domain-containing protein [Acidobacteriota bacterium]|nr:AbrB/MazE/SpoVT family DNA-binding domain-containing protein [Acidobacteriota bacterium]
MPTSTLTSKGQVTIPKQIRDRLSLKVGDRLLFSADDRGNVIIRPQRQEPLGTLDGLLGHLAKARPVSIEEMGKAVRHRAARPYHRVRTV